jgi:cation diffusion facilitator family transporter
MQRPTSRSRARQTAIQGVLAVALAVNLAIAAAKLLFGHRSGSLAMTADGVNTLLDAGGILLALIALHLARRPPDVNHPYGHRKYETFATLGIVGLMFLGCREIVGEAIDRLRHPHEVHASPVAYAVMIASTALTLGVSWLERRRSRSLQSELLLADAEHMRTDVLASALVVASLFAQRFHLGWADLAATAVIVVLIVAAGVGVLRGSFATLADERRLPPAELERVALEERGVREAHNVRSRGPEDDIHVDLHVLVDPRMPIAAAHDVGHRVEQRLLERFDGVTDVVVHVEPAVAEERATRREGGGLKAPD